MNVRTMMKDLESKTSELMGIIEDLSNNTKLSANTVRTQTFQKKHELHNLFIMLELCKELDRNKVEEIRWANALNDWFTSTTTLTAERKAKYTLTVHEGDDVMTILNNNKEMKDVWGRLMKAAKEAGLHIEDGKLVK